MATCFFVVLNLPCVLVLSRESGASCLKKNRFNLVNKGPKAPLLPQDPGHPFQGDAANDPIGQPIDRHLKSNRACPCAQWNDTMSGGWDSRHVPGPKDPMHVFGDQERDAQTDGRGNMAPRSFSNIALRGGDLPHRWTPQWPLGRVCEQIPSPFGRYSKFSFDGELGCDYFDQWLPTLGLDGVQGMALQSFHGHIPECRLVSGL